MMTISRANEYEVVALADGTFAVQILTGGLPIVADGFLTETEAESWIFSQQVIAITEIELPAHI